MTRRLLALMTVTLLAVSGVVAGTAAPVAAAGPTDVVCIDKKWRSNEVLAYSVGAVATYGTETKTGVYASVQRVTWVGSYRIPQEQRLFERVGTINNGGVTSFQKNVRGYLSGAGISFDVTSQVPSAEVGAIIATNKAIKGEEPIAFVDGISTAYYHQTITTIGPLTNVRTRYSITFYTHEYEDRTASYAAEARPERQQRSIVTVGGTTLCQQETHVYAGAVSKAVPVETRCSYNCLVARTDTVTDTVRPYKVGEAVITHEALPGSGIVTGIHHKEDGTPSTPQERAYAGLAHDCMASGGTMISSGSCGSSHPDDPPETTCTEVVSESRPGQTAYYCD